MIKKTLAYGIEVKIVSGPGVPAIINDKVSGVLDLLQCHLSPLQKIAINENDNLCSQVTKGRELRNQKISFNLPSTDIQIVWVYTTCHRANL